MKLVQYIKLVLSLPPHAVAKKGAGLLKQTLDETLLRRRDLMEPTYAGHFHQGVLNRCFSGRGFDFLQHAAEEIFRFSSHCLSHRFDLLGSGLVEVRQSAGVVACRINKSNLKESKRIWALVDKGYVPIDWHIDFKSGYRWREDVWYRDIKYGHKKGVDVKVPWELSRMQHLPCLAWSYALAAKSAEGFNRPETYLREFRNELLDFIAANPPRFGVNWSCTMDVAIRIGNWLAAYDLFKAYGGVFDAEFEKVFLRSVYEHGLHIISNLEWSQRLRGNHYLADLSGLFFVALYCPFLDESKKWLEFSVKELDKEAVSQVYEDGCDFEASTCYHRLALELLFYPALLGRKNGILFSKAYNNRLKKMFEALLYLLKPDGRMPQIGDNDNGRFLEFELPDTAVLDMRYFLPLAALYFDDPAFKVLYGDETPDAFAPYCFPALWCFGEEGVTRWQKMPARRVEALGSTAFTDTGWYVMRDRKEYIIISCGPNGQDGNGGHGHNDKLSFEWQAGGQDVIVDPGTYVYTPDPAWRNWFRSTEFHNTVMIDGYEQNWFSENDHSLFLMNEDSRAEIVQWESNEEKDIFVGRHRGYTRLKQPVIHERKIFWDKKDIHVLEIFDVFTGQGEHSLKWNFHCPIEVTGKLKIVAEQLSWRVETTCFSPFYGWKEEIRKLTAQMITKLPFSVRIMIELKE